MLVYFSHITYKITLQKIPLKILKEIKVLHPSNYMKMSSDSNCIFCKIILDNDRSKIVYEDEEVVIFPDIKPAAPHHYLVVPKIHLPNAKYLLPEHKPLVEKMVHVAKEFIGEKGCDVPNASFGFHWPPFNTISHLHLHAIAPQSEMGFVAKLIFRSNSWWYVPPQYVLSRL